MKQAIPNFVMDLYYTFIESSAMLMLCATLANLIGWAGYSQHQLLFW